MPRSREDMTEVESEEPRRRRRFRWRYAVLVLAGAGVLALLGQRVYLRHKFAARVAALEAAGYPAGPEQLEAMYAPLPAGQENAADVLKEAAGLYRDSLSRQDHRLLPLAGGGEVPASGQDIPEEMKEIVTRFLEENRAGIERLREAARLERCRFETEWSLQGRRHSSAGDVYRPGGLLCLAALEAFEDGRAEAAVADLAGALRLAEFAREAPTTIGLFGCLRLRGRAASVLEWGLGRTSLGEESLARIVEAIGGSDDPEMVTRALTVHRGIMLPWHRRLEWYPSGGLPPAPILAVYEALGYGARDGTMFIDLTEAYIDVTRLPTFRWQAEMARVQQRWEPRLRESMLLSPMAEGGFSGMLKLYLSHVAKIECARAALAVERYRAREGRLPTSLGEVAPVYVGAVPADPYTGRELRYERLRSGFVVYSVGEDGRDDGGWALPAGTRKAPGQTYDIAFAIER